MTANFLAIFTNVGIYNEREELSTIAIGARKFR